MEQLQGHWWSASGYQEDLDPTEQQDLRYNSRGDRQLPGLSRKLVGPLWGLRDCTQLSARGPDTRLPLPWSPELCPHRSAWPRRPMGASERPPGAQHPLVCGRSWSHTGKSQGGQKRGWHVQTPHLDTQACPLGAPQNSQGSIRRFCRGSQATWGSDMGVPDSGRHPLARAQTSACFVPGALPHAGPGQTAQQKRSS